MGALKSISDQDLILLLKEGNHASYSELYQRYYYLLFSYAYKRLGDKEHAKDIIQELFTSLWEKRFSFELKSSFSGYLFTTANNRIINYFLHEDVRGKYASSLAGFIDEDEVKADYLIRERQLSDLIEMEIQRLPEKMRQIFELSRKEHLSHREIADKLSLSEKTVDRQVSNALLRLKSRLLFISALFFFMNS